MALVHPHTLNILLKRAKNLVQFEDYEKIAKDFDALFTRPFDTTYFSPEDIKYLKHEIDTIIIFSFVECPDPIKESLKNIRSHIDPIFVKNLLLAGRLFNEERDIGTISQLPELVKFEIHKILYSDL